MSQNDYNNRRYRKTKEAIKHGQSRDTCNIITKHTQFPKQSM